MPAENPSPALLWYRRQAQENLLRGLTTKGTPRKRRPNGENTHQQLLARRERGLMAWNKRVQRLRADGLTTRGTPRIYAIRRGDATLFRHQLDGLATAIAQCFHDLPPAARVRALLLENHLSAIRKQML